MKDNIKGGRPSQTGRKPKNRAGGHASGAPPPALHPRGAGTGACRAGKLNRGRIQRNKGYKRERGGGRAPTGGRLHPRRLELGVQGGGARVEVVGRVPRVRLLDLLERVAHHEGKLEGSDAHRVLLALEHRPRYARALHPPHGRAAELHLAVLLRLAVELEGHLLGPLAPPPAPVHLVTGVQQVLGPGLPFLPGLNRGLEGAIAVEGDHEAVPEACGDDGLLALHLPLELPHAWPGKAAVVLVPALVPGLARHRIPQTTWRSAEGGSAPRRPPGPDLPGGCGSQSPEEATGSGGRRGQGRRDEALHCRQRRRERGKKDQGKGGGWRG
mmetsp:Transcript_25507/g.64841  ORF Transcript_25507/g.64841 Transcript_25507/m.64841 type:complete len:327 (+) Transcript_25507:282-1262(+)